MATQIFDNDFLHTHPIYQNVHSTLVDVSNRDYAMAPFDKRIECLDMDDYEAHYMQMVLMIVRWMLFLSLRQMFVSKPNISWML